MIIQFFFWQAISQSTSNQLIVKGFYMLRMSDDYCFCRVAQGQPSQRDRRNTATVLRAVIKSHKRLKGTKVIACGCSRRNLKYLFKICSKERVLGYFCVKLQRVMAYKRLLGQLYQKTDAYTEILTRLLSVNFEKNMNTTINNSARLPLK